MTGEKTSSQAELMSQFVIPIEKTSVLSEKAPKYILFGLGFFFIVLSVYMKIYSGLTPPEFTTLVLSATLLLVLGSLICFSQYKAWRELFKEQQKLSADLMRQQYRTALSQREVAWRELIKDRQRDRTVLDIREVLGRKTQGDG